MADSTFKCFKSLCKQVAKQYSPRIIPNCMVNCVFPCLFEKLKSDIHNKAEYDVDELDIRRAVKDLNPKTLVIFIVAL